MTENAYLELERSLGRAESGVDAAEAHGCLCGALCAEGTFQEAEWAAELLPEDAEAATVAALVRILTPVRDATLASLAGDDLDFEPLLPDDDAPLEDRVSALASWCSGFLYGLGRSGGPAELSGDLGEILHDFSEISRAAAAPDEADDEAERDYMELVEFVRASTQLAYDELAAQRLRSGAAGGLRH